MNSLSNGYDSIDMRSSIGMSNYWVIKNISISDDGNLMLLTDIFNQNYLNNRTIDT